MTKFTKREKPYRVPSFPGPIEIRLDGNEGPAPDPALLGALADPELMRRYPDPSGLEARLAERLGVSPDRVLVTAGADDALDRFCRAFVGEGRELILPVPTFEMIARYARVAGARIVEVPWNGPFPAEAILAATGERTVAVAVVSPNNPTGAVVSASELEKLAELDALLLVDCAYGEYADEDLAARAIALEKAVVLRTFSKAWGLAGLRVGYAVGSPDAITAMRAAGAPYPVSSVSLAIAARWVEEGEGAVLASVERVKEERRALAALLAELGIDARPSQANFVLARFRDAGLVRDCLAGLGIAVRAFPDRPELVDALRISLPGDPDRFARLCHGLRAAVAPEAILLDLDGVLADVSASYRACIRESCATWGAEIRPEEIASAKASGDANNDWILTQRLLAARGIEASIDEVIARFESIYQGTSDAPGRWIEERLLFSAEKLRAVASRLPIGIVTGRPRADALRFLERFELLGSISCLIGLEDAPPKPDPAPVSLALRKLGVDRAWMVGDTPDDVRAARAAGVVPFGILAPGDGGGAADAHPPGSSGEEGPMERALLRAGAARILASLDELLEVLP